MSDYPMRSLLFVPGHNQHLLESASKQPADILLLDLEDSVQPAANKQVAREMILKNISHGMFAGRVVFPRVNDLQSGHLLQDLLQLTVPEISGFMYPKSQGGGDIFFLDKLLEAIECEKRLPLGTFKIIPLIETAAAVLHAEEICRASSRVVAIALGSEDLVGELDGLHDEASLGIHFARSAVVLAARASGVRAIDTVHVRVHDLAHLEHHLAMSRVFGFDGMLLLHPKEIAPAHASYSPSPKEVEEAQDIIRLYSEAERLNKGVAILEGKFIGPPMVRKARNVLRKNKRLEP